jgi:RNA-directed DNA polymerase
MSRVPFSQIRTVEGLAANLGCTPADLQTFSSGDQRQFYTRLEIPKKGKRTGFRIVHAPIQHLALIQKNLARWITALTEFDECVQGFVPHRSIGKNAKLHLGARLVLHVDLQDFFDAIRFDAVVRAFGVLGFAPPLAELLSRVCTLNRQLPQGASTSPALANLVCAGLDVDLKRIASSNDCTYSRYADDITISGDTLPETESIAAIVAAHGFRLRDEKCRIQRRGRTQYVTGLTIADTTMPRVARVQKRRLRLEMYYATRFGLANHLERTGSSLTRSEALERFNGWMMFLYSIEGSGRLFEMWRALMEREPESTPNDVGRDEPAGA